MRHCKNCGGPLPENSRFCPGCGTAVKGRQEKSGPAWDCTGGPAGCDAALDVKQNKAMGVVAYLGLLVLVPIFASPRSRFARFHANQGLALLLCSTGYNLLRSFVFGAWLGTALWQAAVQEFFAPWNVGMLVAGVLSEAVDLALLALAILGTVRAAKGQMRELPVIGKLRLLR